MRAPGQGYSRFGTFWLAPQADQPEPSRTTTVELDRFDVAGFKDWLDRRFAEACRRIDDTSLTGDELLRATAYRTALADVLRRFAVDGQRPAAPAASEEPRT